MLSMIDPVKLLDGHFNWSSSIDNELNGLAVLPQLEIGHAQEHCHLIVGEADAEDERKGRAEHEVHAVRRDVHVVISSVAAGEQKVVYAADLALEKCFSAKVIDRH